MNDHPSAPDRPAQPAWGQTGAMPWAAGHRIGSFEFRGVVAVRPTAVVYRGWDHALETPVALKEYLPAALARRDARGDVEPADATLAEPFERGLRAFIAEGRQLARCDHPSLARALQLLSAHGGACLVMPWYAGRPLADLRREMAGPPDEPALRALLASLLSALHAWHRVNGVHGGVHPSGVLLLDDDRPLLLGPNLVQRVVARGASPYPADPDFAAPEWSGDPAGVGPWSDVHGLAQLARFAITGLPASETLDQPLAALVDRLFPGVAAARYAPGLLAALDRAASADVGDRPRSVAEFAGWIEYGPPARVARAPDIDLELDLPAPEAWPAAWPDAEGRRAARAAPAGARVDLPLPDPLPTLDFAPRPLQTGGNFSPDWSQWPESPPVLGQAPPAADLAADAVAEPGAPNAGGATTFPAWRMPAPPVARDDAAPPQADGAGTPPPNEGDRLGAGGGSAAGVRGRPPAGAASADGDGDGDGDGRGGRGAGARPGDRRPGAGGPGAEAGVPGASGPGARDRGIGAAGERREPPWVAPSPGTARRRVPDDEEEPDAATIELIQRVLDSIPPAPPRREPPDVAARPAGAPVHPSPGTAAEAPERAEERSVPAGAGGIARWAPVALAIVVMAGGALWWTQRDAVAPAPAPTAARSVTPGEPAVPAAPSGLPTPAGAAVGSDLDPPAGDAGTFVGAATGVGGGTGNRNRSGVESETGPGTGTPAVPTARMPTPTPTPTPTPSVDPATASPAADATPLPPAGAGLAGPALAPRETFVDAPATRPAAAPQSPREACGERTEFSLYRCMQQQCERGAWARHAQCVAFRATDRVPS